MIPMCVTLLVVLFAAYILKSMIKPKNYPPGPRWYPLVGCSRIVEKMSKTHGSQWKGLSYLAKLYSTEVLGIKLGSELFVIVFGERHIRHVFIEPEFEGRPNSFFLRLRCLGKKLGITFADGPLWKEQRHFTMKQLRNVGFGKTEMEKEIQMQLGYIIERLKSERNPVKPKKIFGSVVMDVLWKFVAGERIKQDKLVNLLDLLNARSKAFSMAGGWLNQMPWSRFIFPELSGYSLIVRINQQISDIIEEAIEKHKKKSVPGNDFIYEYMKEIREGESTFTEEQLKIICLDLIIAGSQTTSNVISFALLAVLRYKEIQKKIHEEIKEVIGDNVPCWSDSAKLTYVSAFLLEVHRYYTIVPVAGPRRVLEATTLDGYTIPKDTTVLISLGDLHYDPKLWDLPHKFYPERFIDEKGALKNPAHMPLYPFGMGRRRCPGDTLARSFIFIVFVGLLQKFRIECSNGTLPSEDPIIGILSSPRDFSADFLCRK